MELDSFTPADTEEMGECVPTVEVQEYAGEECVQSTVTDEMEKEEEQCYEAWKRHIFDQDYLEFKEFVMKNVREMKEEISSATKDVEENRADTQRLVKRLDCVENVQRKNCLIFYNIPEPSRHETKYELMDSINNYCNFYLRVGMKYEYLDDVARLGKNQSPRPILVTFKSRVYKLEVLKAWDVVKPVCEHVFRVVEYFGKRTHENRKRLVQFGQCIDNNNFKRLRHDKLIITFDTGDNAYDKTYAVDDSTGLVRPITP